MRFVRFLAVPIFLFSVVFSSLMLIAPPVSAASIADQANTYCTKKNPVSPDDNNDGDTSSDEAFRDECALEYKTGAKYATDGKDRPKSCTDACSAGYSAGKDAAKKQVSYCDKAFSGSNKKSQAAACKKGVAGGAAGKKVDDVCKSYRGNDRSACKTGFSKGQASAPNSSNGSVGDPNLNCGGADSGVCDPGLPAPSAGPDQVNTILNIAIKILGAIAVLVIVLSGLRMVTAQGDAQQVSKARNGILYAVIGLLVAVVAQSIVYFALNKV